MLDEALQTAYTSHPIRNVHPLSLALARFWQMPDVAKLDLRHREWLYALRADTDPGLIKLGRARELKARMIGIQTQCPVALKLIAACSAPAGTKAILHQLLAEDRQHGEWFLPSAGVLEIVAKLPKGGMLTPSAVHDLAPGIDCQALFLAASRRSMSREQRELAASQAIKNRLSNSRRR